MAQDKDRTRKPSAQVDGRLRGNGDQPCRGVDEGTVWEFRHFRPFRKPMTEFGAKHVQHAKEQGSKQTRGLICDKDFLGAGALH